ncbi:Proline dehydrogenase, mitochondrial [Wickerhamiella sorbophila]|uniref:Proline dehydrogenase n=1 Tax=Wickerhamiella sorbophila TaxID=45607 RepID=A0A2T0FJX9_9ASCO|nr:Proline dehydrogenase, mitochondrial [Wickerhamiella sorbophila]PRT55304.1 Proline dehydrogenase, mitochondrial [Wickerhamiella sorbophila]
MFRKQFRPLGPLARYVSTRPRKAAVSMAPPPLRMNPLESAGKTPKGEPSMDNFLKRIGSSDLLWFTLLSVVTASPFLTRVAMAAMPITPDFLIKSVVYPIYCGGENYDEVRATGRKLLNRGVSNMMLSYSVEDAEGTASAETFENSLRAINGSVAGVFAKHNKESQELYETSAINTPPASGYIALKPTGLMPNSAEILANYNKPEFADKWEQYLNVCRSICQNAVDHGEGKVVIVFDAEKVWLQDGVYAAQREMMKEFNRDGQVVVCGTVQMYLQKSYQFLNNEIELAKKGNYQVAMKLVRGAYIRSEPNRMQDIHVTKEATDKSFNDGSNLMLDYIVQGWNNPTKPSPVGQLVVASHNFDSCNMIDARMKREAPVGFDHAKDCSVVFAQLLGMNDHQTCDLTDRGLKVIKYVPWGPVKETKDYLHRRLEENTDAARGGWSNVFAGVNEMVRRAFRVSRA